MAVQYAKAMGMRVIALDVGKEKLEYTKRLGAEFSFDATSLTVVEDVTKEVVTVFFAWPQTSLPSLLPLALPDARVLLCLLACQLEIAIYQFSMSF